MKTDLQRIQEIVSNLKDGEFLIKFLKKELERHFYEIREEERMHGRVGIKLAIEEEKEACMLQKKELCDTLNNIYNKK